MQISRHWRLNAQRYRLEGFRAPSGEVKLTSQALPQNTEAVQAAKEPTTQPTARRAAVAAR